MINTRPVCSNYWAFVSSGLSDTEDGFSTVTASVPLSLYRTNRLFIMRFSWDTVPIKLGLAGRTNTGRRGQKRRQDTELRYHFPIGVQPLLQTESRR